MIVHKLTWNETCFFIKILKAKVSIECYEEDANLVYHLYGIYLTSIYNTKISDIKYQNEYQTKPKKSAY